MVLLPAAFLALSVHVLPAIAFAFPSPQTSSDQCLATSACTTVVNSFTYCNVDLSATSFTTTEERCLCTYRDFPSATTTCFACMGEADPGLESYCATYTSGSSSASSAGSATSTRSATASRTSAATSATGSSSSDCASSSACTSLASTLSSCSVTLDDLSGTISDADMTCMCSSRSFEADIASCLACAGESTTGVDTICDSYTSASGSASGTVGSTRATSTSGSDSTASSPTGSSGSGSGSGSRSGSTTGLTSGLATNQNGAGSLTVPGLVVPALVMAAAAWRMMF